MSKSRDASISLPNTWKLGRNFSSIKTRQELQHRQLQRPSSTRFKPKCISHSVYPGVSRTGTSEVESMQEPSISEGDNTTNINSEKANPTRGSSHSYSTVFSDPLLSSSVSLTTSGAICIGEHSTHRFVCSKVSSSPSCNSTTRKMGCKREGRSGRNHDVAPKLYPSRFQRSALECSDSQTQPCCSSSDHQPRLEVGSTPSASNFLDNTKGDSRRLVVSSSRRLFQRRRCITRVGAGSTTVLKRNRRLRPQKRLEKSPRYDSAECCSGGAGSIRKFSSFSHFFPIAMSSPSSSVSYDHVVSSDAGRSELSAEALGHPPVDQGQFLSESSNFVSSQSLVLKMNENCDAMDRGLEPINSTIVSMECKNVSVTTVSSSSSDPHSLTSSIEPDQRGLKMEDSILKGRLGSPTETRIPLGGDHSIESSSHPNGSIDVVLQSLSQELKVVETVATEDFDIEKGEVPMKLPVEQTYFHKSELASANADLKEASHPNRRLPNGRVLHNGPHENLFIALPCISNIHSDVHTETPGCGAPPRSQGCCLLSRRYAHAFVDKCDIHHPSAYPPFSGFGFSSSTSSRILAEDSNFNKMNFPNSSCADYSNHNSSQVMNCESDLSNEVLFSSTLRRKLESFTAVEVIPGLFLGAASDATNLEAVSYHGISLIINITHECAIEPTIEYDKYGIRILRFPLSDHSDEMISPLFLPLARIIHEQLHRREVFFSYKAAKKHHKDKAGASQRCSRRKFSGATHVVGSSSDVEGGDGTTSSGGGDLPFALSLSSAREGRGCMSNTPTLEGDNPCYDPRGDTSVNGVSSGALRIPTTTLSDKPMGDISCPSGDSCEPAEEDPLETCVEEGSPTMDASPLLRDLDPRDCGGVLVHCRMGVSRSASILLAYLILYGTAVAPLGGDGAALTSPLRREFIRRLFMDGARRERQLTESVGGFVVTPPRAMFLGHTHPRAPVPGPGPGRVPVPSRGSGPGPNKGSGLRPHAFMAGRRPHGLRGGAAPEALQPDEASESSGGAAEQLTPRTLAALSCWPCLQRRLQARPPASGTSNALWSPLFSPVFSQQLLRSAAALGTTSSPLSLHPTPQARFCQGSMSSFTTPTKAMPIPTEMGFSFPSFGAEDANPTQGGPAQPNLQNSPKKGAPEDYPSQQQAGKPATEVQPGEGIPFAKGPFGMTMGMRSKGPSTAGSGRLLVDTPWELRPDGKDAVVETDVLERNALVAPNDESGDSRVEERLPTQRLLRGRSVAVHRSNPTTPSTLSKYPPSAAIRAVPGFCPHSTPLSSVKDALFLGWEAQPCMTYQEAFDFLKSKKKEVSPNIGFVLALRELAGGCDFSLSSSL